ncbi:hypothetical protein KPG66_00810 [Mycetohabitans sp. B2]|uniref:hypothetical protein n=1 Tax=Mycetohabitans sp. B2 TaxID=2841274 RepID=UPI001F421C6E|nr:hypothetical protein [Mycetohabitans sp. B2]MCF7694705.1 hypothetical protein [Mycetohabitans sp. B2]
MLEFLALASIMKLPIAMSRSVGLTATAARRQPDSPIFSALPTRSAFNEAQGDFS